MKAEEEDSDEDDVPEEWHLAATMAGCADVNEMLSELDRRVSASEEVCISTFLARLARIRCLWMNFRVDLSCDSPPASLQTGIHVDPHPPSHPCP